MSEKRHLRGHEPRDASASDYSGMAQRKQSASKNEPLDLFGDGNSYTIPVENKIFSGPRIDPRGVTKEVERTKGVDARTLRVCHELPVDKGLYEGRVKLSLLERRDILLRDSTRDEMVGAKDRSKIGGQKKIYYDEGNDELDVNLDSENNATGQVQYNLSGRSTKNLPGSNSQKSLTGLIFMCNDRIRRRCFRYGVFGMPMAKKHLVDQVKPGTKLFLFEFEARVLWGIYEAITYAGLDLEPDAYRGSEVPLPAQVRFCVYKKFNPLAEWDFRVAIQENYYEPSKFKFELTADQVLKLMRLYKPGETVREREDETKALELSLLTRSLHYRGNHLAIDKVDAFSFKRKNTWEKDFDGSRIAVSRQPYSKVKQKGFRRVSTVAANCWIDEVERPLLDKVIKSRFAIENFSEIGTLQSAKHSTKQAARDAQAGRFTLNSLRGGSPETYLEQNWIDKPQADLIDKAGQENRLVYGMQTEMERKGQLIYSKKDLVRHTNVVNDIHIIKRRGLPVEDEYLYRHQKQYINHQSCEADLNISCDSIQRMCDVEYYDDAEDGLARMKQHDCKKIIGGWASSVPSSLGGLNRTMTTSRDRNNNLDELQNPAAGYKKLSPSYVLKSNDDDRRPVSFENAADLGNLTMTSRNEDAGGSELYYPENTMMIYRKRKHGKDFTKKIDLALQDNLEKKVQTSVMRRFGESFRPVKVKCSTDVTQSEQVEDASRALEPPSGKDIEIRKLSVWSRLSGPAKLNVARGSMFSTKDKNLNILDSRELFAKKKKWFHSWVDQGPSVSEIKGVEDQWEDTLQTKIEDPLDEDFSMDFKRRKCGLNDSSVDVDQNNAAYAPGRLFKSELAVKRSRNSAGNIVNQKGRRRIVRPFLVDNYKLILQENRSLESSKGKV